MKKDEEAWLHLRELAPKKEQQTKMLSAITVRKEKRSFHWQIPVTLSLFIAVTTILLLSVIQAQPRPIQTAEAHKKLSAVYLMTNEDSQSFIAKDSCLYLPQSCYLNQNTLAQFSAEIEQAKNVVVTKKDFQFNPDPVDILAVYSDGSQQRLKVLDNNILYNVDTKEAKELPEHYGSIFSESPHPFGKYYFGITYIFILLLHFTLWAAKKRMPHIQRRFFAADKKHAIANGVMLAIFLTILCSIYLLTGFINLLLIYVLFTIYSVMQIYYRKKAGEPTGYLVASGIVQLCIGISFSLLLLPFWYSKP